MKKIQNKILSVIAKASKSAADKACGAISFWGCYQPKEPAMLREKAKK
ncbi:MAG TPA: hypothetical protein DDX91_04315 [Ruminococcaceae bacterium]|nr:hypothetical protein [Oscillospiraceae bacterium]